MPPRERRPISVLNAASVLVAVDDKKNALARAAVQTQIQAIKELGCVFVDNLADAHKEEYKTLPKIILSESKPTLNCAMEAGHVGILVLNAYPDTLPEALLENRLAVVAKVMKEGGTCQSQLINQATVPELIIPSPAQAAASAQLRKVQPLRGNEQFLILILSTIQPIQQTRLQNTISALQSTASSYKVSIEVVQGKVKNEQLHGKRAIVIGSDEKFLQENVRNKGHVAINDNGSPTSLLSILLKIGSAIKEKTEIQSATYEGGYTALFPVYAFEKSKLLQVESAALPKGWYCDEADNILKFNDVATHPLNADLLNEHIDKLKCEVRSLHSLTQQTVLGTLESINDFYDRHFQPAADPNSFWFLRRLFKANRDAKKVFSAEQSEQIGTLKKEIEAIVNKATEQRWCSSADAKAALKGSPIFRRIQHGQRAGLAMVNRSRCEFFCCRRTNFVRKNTATAKRLYKLLKSS